MERSGKGKEASRLRHERIDERSTDPVFYNAEADYQLAQGQPEEALRLLDFGLQCGAVDAYTDSIRATALERSGKGKEASRPKRDNVE